jgi:hypothetical protein
MRRRTTALIVATVVIAGGGGYTVYRIETGGRVTEVGLADALERYREQSDATASVAAPEPAAPTSPTSTTPTTTVMPTTATTSPPAPVRASLPAPGVYQYATNGFDQIDTLGGARHDYPAVTTMTVIPHGCGVQLRWDVAAERWNTWDWCIEGDAIRQTAWFAYHEFFGVGGENAYACDGDPRPLDAPAGTRWTMTCRMDDRTTSTFRASVVDRTTLPVAGADVPVLHVRYDVDVAGESTGTQVLESWYRTGDGLVVREQLTTATVQSTVIGDAIFEEAYTIDLLTPTPAS